MVAASCVMIIFKMIFGCCDNGFDCMLVKLANDKRKGVLKIRRKIKKNRIRRKKNQTVVSEKSFPVFFFLIVYFIWTKV